MATAGAVFALGAPTDLNVRRNRAKVSLVGELAVGRGEPGRDQNLLGRSAPLAEMVFLFRPDAT